jgi:hypothetical protein
MDTPISSASHEIAVQIERCGDTITTASANGDVPTIVATCGIIAALSEQLVAALAAEAEARLAARSGT